jgi:predicted O-methyltransferase YrrM
MLTRKPDWMGYLGISESQRAAAAQIMADTLRISENMMHAADIEALAAALLAVRPKRIFEIGTYRGASAQMMLRLLPEATVVSIAFASSATPGKRFNNDELPVEAVGSLITADNRPRFTQLIGDSHVIDPGQFLRDHGPMDLVFIDGDHSRKGVGQDTDLARAILAPDGAIAWHDANPKPKYIGSRLFLEQDLPELALATPDDFIGGVAFWTARLEARLRAETPLG